MSKFANRVNKSNIYSMYKYIRVHVKALPMKYLFTLIKKETKFSLYIRKFRVEQLQSHI
jgi:hypothetical protein